MLYEILTGTPPFTASSPSELARLHISARPLPLSEYVPDVPPALEEIVMKVLSKEPAMRYRTADQLGRVLEKFGTAPTTVKPVKEPVSQPVITIKQDMRSISPTSQPHRLSRIIPRTGVPADISASNNSAGACSRLRMSPPLKKQTGSPSSRSIRRPGMGWSASLLADGLVQLLPTQLKNQT